MDDIVDGSGPDLGFRVSGSVLWFFLARWRLIFSALGRGVFVSGARRLPFIERVWFARRLSLKEEVWGARRLSFSEEVWGARRLPFSEGV